MYSAFEISVDPYELASEKPAHMALQCFQGGIYMYLESALSVLSIKYS